MLNALYKDSLISLFVCDCITGMKELPSGLCDLIVTSPPYNVGKEYEKDQDFGSYLKLIHDFYTEGKRIIKNGGYCIVVVAPFYIGYSGVHQRYQPTEYMHHVIAEKAGWVHGTTRIWEKDFATLDDKYSISTTLPKLEWEYILCFRKPGGGKEKIREQNVHPRAIWSTSGIRQQNSSSLQRHVAAFPEVLVQKALTVYSDESDTVVDPFSGGGTTLYVAKKMNRSAIGFEINPEYAQKSIKLLQQLTLDQMDVQQVGVIDQMSLDGVGNEEKPDERANKEEHNPIPEEYSFPS